MIHTANEYVAKHHRYLLSGVTIGLKGLDGKNGASEEADKGSRLPAAASLPHTSDFKTHKNPGQSITSISHSLQALLAYSFNSK